MTTDEADALIKIQITHLTEAVRDLKEVVKELKEDFKDDYVSRELYDAEKKDLAKDVQASNARIDSLSKGLTWAVFLIVGAFITATVNMLLDTGVIKQ